MNIEHSLQFWIQHNEAIIQWIVVAILATTALWLIRMLTDKPKKDAPVATANLGELEETLKKLLERASAVVATPTSPTLEQAFANNSSGAPSADPGLKAELEKREKEIAELKNQLSAVPKADTSQYTAKIAELETKLAEYEILEDDIADLSLYKEENIRLKEELGKVKGGGEAPVEAVATAVVATEVTSAAEAFPEFPGEEAPAAATPDPVAATPAPEPVPAKKENLVAEFEEAVKQVTPPPVAPVAAAPTPTPTAPAPAPAAAATPDVDTDDILAEFAGEGLDTDKMLAEIESLNQAGAADSSALEEASDINKMVEEATKLGS